MSAVNIRVVGYGRPATDAIATVIAAAQAGHPLDPVTVVVASNLAGLSLRRLLGSGQAGIRGLANVSFVTPFRLAELLGAEQVTGHPITNAVLAATARQVLRDEPGSFRAVAEHPASEQALMALYAELSHVRPETLTALADRSGRTAEVIRLFRAMRSRLVDVHDEDDLARAAVDRITTDPSTTEVLGTVAWHLPDRLTPALGELVGISLRTRPSHAIVALTGDIEADATVLSACELAGVVISPEDIPGDDPVVGTKIISVSDDDDEVRTVIREIAALAEAGVPLDRIGVFHPTPDPYARRIHEQLTAAGIPHNGPSRTRLADRAAGRTLLAALALPGAQWSRARVLALLTGGPVRHDGRTVPSGAWENVSRQAGVVGGRDDWRVKLDAFAAAGRHERNRLAEEGDQPSWRLDRKTADADFAESLADFVDSIAGGLEALDQAVGWTAKASAALDLMEQLMGPEGRRTAWPDHERAAAERIESALTRLQQLDDIEPEPTTASFVRAVTSELEIVDGRVGRFGEGVVFGPLAMAAGLDLDAIFVVGLAEGTCPAPRREDPLLTDEDREASAGELIRREERMQEQHRHYLAALAAGGDHQVLLFPRGNLRGGRDRLPSRWLLQTASAINGSHVHSSAFADLDRAVVTEVASFARGLVTASTPGSAAERDLAVMAVHAGDGGDPASHPVTPPALRRALGGIAARRSGDFTEWDGNLAGQSVPSPTDGVVASASRLQTWAECPLRYYFAYVLRLADRDDPETLTSIGAADRGTLVHEVLELFIGEVIGRPGGAPAPTDAWTDADRDRLHTIADEVFNRFEQEGKTGRALLWRLERQLVLADLDGFLDKDNAYRAAFGATPVRVELPFGYEPAEPLTLDVGDGRTLQFRGRADRVDTTTSGRHIVLDYKTGKGDSYKKLDTDPVLAGTTLQLGLYAEAARDQIGADDVEAYYWMISSKGGFKRHGYEWTEDRKDRFLDVLGTIVEGIDTGTFPARPGAYDSFFRNHENCGWCDFNDICPRDRDDHEEAMKEAPELQILQKLLPPEADNDGAAGEAP